MTAVQSSPPPPFLDRLDHPIAGSSTRIYSPVASRAVPPIASITSPSSPSKRDVLSRGSTPSRPPSRTERKFKCEWEGCDKAYFKPARLREHALSHTGERPHVCDVCGQSYLRATHLAAHVRTHKSDEERQFRCSRDGCKKRFWTATHLKRHEQWHDEAVSYKCELCDESFHKTHQMREHTALAHMPAGTKPFLCSQEGCGASFAMKAHLKAHAKTHDATRYTCSEPSHTDTFPVFPTWSALQAHTKEAHPPQCHHPECGGRTFTSKQNLRTHLKVHAQREADLTAKAAGQLDVEEDKENLMSLERRRPKRPRGRANADEEETDDQLRVAKQARLGRVTGGEAGKEHACPEASCGKRFKTKHAATSHHASAHLHTATYKCNRDGCNGSFGKFGDLKRHIAAEHTAPAAPSPGSSTIAENGTEKTPVPKAEREEDKPYAIWKLWETERRAFPCPIHKTGVADGECKARFTRVYDVRRHLVAEHMLELEDEEVRRLLLSGDEEFLPELPESQPVQEEWSSGEKP